MIAKERESTIARKGEGEQDILDDVEAAIVSLYVLCLQNTTVHSCH